MKRAYFLELNTKSRTRPQSLTEKGKETFSLRTLLKDQLPFKYMVKKIIQSVLLHFIEKMFWILNGLLSMTSYISRVIRICVGDVKNSVTSKKTVWLRGRWSENCPKTQSTDVCFTFLNRCSLHYVILWCSVNIRGMYNVNFHPTLKRNAPLLSKAAGSTYYLGLHSNTWEFWIFFILSVKSVGEQFCKNS